MYDGGYVLCEAGTQTSKIIYMNTSLSLVFLKLQQLHVQGLTLDFAYLKVELEVIFSWLKLFRGFPQSQNKCWSCTQILTCTACVSFSPPNIN
jgi:hypothetical protein